MPNATDYLSQRLMKGKKLPTPKLGGGSKLTPQSIFSGQHELGDVATTMNAGLGGLFTSPIDNPYSSKFLFKKR